jgi:hypothetical protein
MRPHAALILLLLCLLGSPARRGAHAKTTYLHFGLENNSTTVRVVQGDTLSLGFYSLLSTGYSWMLLSSPRAVLNFTSYHKQEAPPDNFMWNATALRPGMDNLTFACGTPWSGVAQTVHIQVLCE